MTYTSHEVTVGLESLGGLLSIKLLNWFYNSAVGVLRNYTSFTTMVTNIDNALGALYDPIQYLVINPVLFAGSYASFNYTDLMMIILFGMVGTTFDPTNAFCQWMFFYIPLFRVGSTLFFLYLSNGISTIQNLVSGNTLVSKIYSTAATFLSMILTTAYTLGPLVIAGNVYYPQVI